MSLSLGVVVIFLGAAVIAVLVAQKLGLGSVVGYLIAGIVIGPWGLGLIGQVHDVLHVAEYGVVFLLFIIGLEMQPRRLWALRRSIIALGGLQVLVTGLVLAVASALAIGLSLQAALVTGFALALSSTAFAMQMLGARGELTARHGRAAFATLLFQDLAVIPILALLPLLSVGQSEITLVGGLVKTATVAAVIGGLVVGGHYVLQPVLRIVAATRMREVFVAMSLLIVMGTAWIMAATGISVALGAFVAGVLLADSGYRHELQANIDPFKDMLLGLFFIAVGMSINLGLIAARPVYVVALTFGLAVIKGGLLTVLARRHGLSWAASRNLASYLGQGSEFAFVIFPVALAKHLLAPGDADLLVAIVTLSMVLTPLAVQGTAWLNKRLAMAGKPYEFDTPNEPEHPVIIAGFGRVGGIVGRMLRAKRIGFVALEVNPDQVNFVRRFGARVYYGDASRARILHAAGAGDARVLVVAMANVETSLRTIKMAQTYFPHLKIVARAHDRRHAYQLMNMGVTVFERETFLSSVALAGNTMRALGVRAAEVERAQKTFKKYDNAHLAEYHKVANDEERMARLARESMAELEELFERDAVELEESESEPEKKRLRVPGPLNKKERKDKSNKDNKDKEEGDSGQ